MPCLAGVCRGRLGLTRPGAAHDATANRCALAPAILNEDSPRLDGGHPDVYYEPLHLADAVAQTGTQTRDERQLTMHHERGRRIREGFWR